MNHKLELLLSAPKSFYASWRLTSFHQAFSLPVLVRYNTVIRSLKGKLKSPNLGKKRAILYVGFDCGEGTGDPKIRSVLQIDGTIHIENSARIGIGSRICILKGAVWEIGSIIGTSRVFVVCHKHIKNGYKLWAAWESTIMDSDLHPIRNVETGEIRKPHKDIIIGDNVWLGTKSIVLKGSIIPSGCIIGAMSVVSKKFNKENTIIAGNPAQEIRSGYTIYDHFENK
jgi:acetyltransferase-like isoleucine patch superfamily enzyme